MDFSLSPRDEDFRTRVRAFVEQHVLPLESDPSLFEHENIREDVVARVRKLAKAEGLWSLQMPRERGGAGLSKVGMAACYEEAARSPFGPVMFNSAPPDDGNMMVLDKILATEELKQKWLQPIVDGKVRSAFAMTEPDGGCGSDPSLTYTRATKHGDTWRVHGRKHFITGAEGAQHFILVARTGEENRRGLTAFLFHADQPGWRIVRRIPIMGPEEHGGHCELEFDGLEIPDENRLLNVGDGLKVTQIRLGPARLTHCMRWLGLSKRCMEIAGEYVKNRSSFGSKLADHEGVQWMIGEVAKEIQVGRLLTMNAAWKLDQGDHAKADISIAKIHVADTLHKAADTALQLMGARGYSKDTLVDWIYRYARQARLVDGASEVHKMVLSQAYLANPSGFFAWRSSGANETR